jgi:hypothetical protein
MDCLRDSHFQEVLWWTDVPVTPLYKVCAQDSFQGTCNHVSMLHLATVCDLNAYALKHPCCAVEQLIVLIMTLLKQSAEYLLLI